DVIIEKDGSVRFKAGGNERTVPLQNLESTAKNWIKDQPEDTPVLISADKNVSYDSVMQAMSALKRAGVSRIALAVNGN
nr:biopolymer transporter ExbD [Alicycliphilus sp.]